MGLSINSNEKEKLFRQVKHRLGAPIRKIELDDDQMCTLLEIAIEDHSSFINDWLIEHQWKSVYGLDLNKQDLLLALTTRGLGYEDSYTYAYSKIVGLQARGPWELKQDFVEIVQGQQVYEIPAGREINEVLWITPPTIDHALFSFYGGSGAFGSGFGSAQVPMAGFGGFGNGGNGFFMAPSYDVILRDVDLGLKQRLISSDLIYTITAGPNGTKLLHLIPPPGSRLNFGGFGNSTADLTGSRVWYYYYETNSTEERMRCLNENKDIVKLPSDVPVSVVNFDELNTPSKQWVRDWFTSLCKETLGRVRGKFGGSLGAGEKEVTMDYESLLSESREDKEKLLTRLQERLARLSPEKMLERSAQEAEFLNKSLQYRPLGIMVI